MKRSLVLMYGLISYLLFFGTFLYAFGFVGNLFVPKSIDGAPQVPLLTAIVVNAALLLVFALQHSIMARPAFKKWWTKIIPEPAERSTYVLLSSLCLLLLVWQWQPMGGFVWVIESPVIKTILTVLFITGWLIVLLSTFMINHFDLFGLRQVWFYFTGKKYEPLRFRIPFFYKYVRHPLYLGWLIAFWATPVMSAAHLLFAILTTGYIFTAIWFEERDLVTHFGSKYSEYKKKVPMIFPTGDKNAA
ncbi:MAG: isoprenylcysteine carboxylmethyltransferase family protein [Bacteroidetes bacterium]|nr:MAG: isoprenylcysteine carboxylmethyltransferase family protein [Bacteroidota bacterium]